MKKVLLVVAVFALSTATARADGSVPISASPVGQSTVGQAIRFSVAFTVSCADGVSTHFFSVDGGRVSDKNFSLSGQNATDSFTTSRLTAGRHNIGYHWDTTNFSGQSCQGDGTLEYSVVAPPVAPPPPPEKTSPSPVLPPPPSPPAQSPSASPGQVATPVRLGGDIVAGHQVLPVGTLLFVGAVVVLVGAGSLFFRAQRRK